MLISPARARLDFAEQGDSPYALISVSIGHNRSVRNNLQIKPDAREGNTSRTGTRLGSISILRICGIRVSLVGSSYRFAVPPSAICTRYPIRLGSLLNVFLEFSRTRASPSER